MSTKWCLLTVNRFSLVYNVCALKQAMCPQGGLISEAQFCSDLGGTLVHYFEGLEFPGILEQAITEVHNYLRQESLLNIPRDHVVESRRRGSRSQRVPRQALEKRLVRIFQLDDLVQSSSVISTMCWYFMKPIFARGCCYEDTFPTLQQLRSRGFQGGDWVENLDEFQCQPVSLRVL